MVCVCDRGLFAARFLYEIKVLLFCMWVVSLRPDTSLRASLYQNLKFFVGIDFTFYSTHRTHHTMLYDVWNKKFGSVCQRIQRNRNEKGPLKTKTFSV